MKERYGLRLIRKIGGIGLVLALGSAPAWAALGGTEASVSADQQVLRGQLSTEVHEGYQRHIIATPGGAVVREYVSPAGKVFGVSWQGAFVPSLQQLLGTYFTHLQQYAQAQTGRHGGPLIIQQQDFVFSSGGHMRWRHGRAYVPSLLPANVSPEVVQ